MVILLTVQLQIILIVIVENIFLTFYTSDRKDIVGPRATRREIFLIKQSMQSTFKYKNCKTKQTHKNTFF